MSGRLQVLGEAAVTYLEAQSKESEAMLGVFDLVQEQGFTAGINYQSRETLLDGFRAFMRAKQNDVPTLPKKEEELERPARVQ